MTNTSQDCKNFIEKYLKENYPDVFKFIQEKNVDFKRLKKYGKNPTTRIFRADKAPLLAHVHEDNESNLTMELYVEKPWDYGIENDESVRWNTFSDEDLWKREPFKSLVENSVKPNQFYYSIIQNDMWGNGNLTNCVVITPITHFKNFGLYDQHLPIEHILPKCIKTPDCMECVWEIKEEYNKEQAENQFKSTGFVFINEHHEYVMDEFDEN